MPGLSKISNFFYVFRQSARNDLEKTWACLHVKIYLSSLAFVNLAIWLTARYIVAKTGGELIALHYSVEFGINLIGGPAQLYVIPTLGLLIIVINFILLCAIAGYKGRKFASHILLSGALISNIILFISLVSIYLVNFR